MVSLNYMIIKDITAQLPWAMSLGKRELKAIDKIVVHHTAVKQNGKLEIDRIKTDAAFHVSKGWGHIAYHYMIGISGTVYQCYGLQEIGAHAGDWAVNKSSVAVCLDGDLSLEPLKSEQLASLWSLLDYLCTQRPDLPAVVKGTIKTHREVRPLPTACPSERVQKIVDAYRVV